MRQAFPTAYLSLVVKYQPFGTSSLALGPVTHGKEPNAVNTAFGLEISQRVTLGATRKSFREGAQRLILNESNHFMTMKYQ